MSRVPGWDKLFPSEGGPLYVPCMLLSAVIALPLFLMLLFVFVYWLPEVLIRATADLLGPRLIAGLTGAVLCALGVAIAVRLVWKGWPRTSTSWGRVIIVVTVIGLVVGGLYLLVVLGVMAPEAGSSF